MNPKGKTPLSAAVSKDHGHTWKKIGDIDGGDTMLTNLGCTFMGNGRALVTYLHINDPEVKDGKFAGRTGPGWHAGHVGLKCAIINPEWFAGE